jgi:hypothetical protein
VTEKVLPYDRAVVRQEKFWDCGPASCQVVLNSRSIIRSEADLIQQIGTTVNGTNYVGLIERVLDLIVPDARYTSVEMPTDPPQFVAGGTGPHVTYDTTDAVPGVNHIAHAVGHVNAVCVSAAARAAA